MADAVHWAWLQPTSLAGFDPTDDNNLDASLNGMAVSTATYLEYGLRDLDGDGIVYDLDADDGTTTAAGEGMVYNGAVYAPQEVAIYDGSTVIANGVEYTLPLVVILSETGNYGVRILDGYFPADTYPSDFTSATLGTLRAVEYTGATIDALDDMLCFADDVPIRTPHGWRAAGELREGDLVTTLRGEKPLVWTVRFTATQPPVVIPQGAFGAQLPIRLSRAHNLLMSSPLADLMFGSADVLIAAGALVGRAGVHIAQRPPANYVHLMCADHEVLEVPGLYCESYHPGPWGLRNLPSCAQAGLTKATCGRFPAARYPILKRKEAELLLNAMGADDDNAARLISPPRGDAQANPAFC
ncbi:hypothetical protein E4Z66_12925 [Aliishimia ponticola]|uniref:Hedgehog/Intein (Hint) domain-containing protein n=1 Tax=Aliishimia ponticola TaxID=2499833 RepID=A0A4S4N9N1_9RHOB|nr:Hint domain-containing protein [Aliishimia ponticola]THH35964.1 hypothetical protein E4Z66_12925 [Aliishimia ponticola]